MSLRHYLLWLTLAPLAFSLAWLITWTLCELHPSSLSNPIHQKP